MIRLASVRRHAKELVRRTGPVPVLQLGPIAERIFAVLLRATEAR
jgi:hypothetical protein